MAATTYAGSTPPAKALAITGVVAGREDAESTYRVRGDGPRRSLVGPLVTLGAGALLIAMP